jgi:hypothetical protein
LKREPRIVNAYLKRLADAKIITLVMSAVSPQGVDVYAFKQPSAEELSHDYLWRCAKVLPERGRIAIFNRSYYEELAVVRVHRALLEHERLPAEPSGTHLWKDRYEDIVAFELHLARNGTVIVKFFLHLSKDEQRKRLLERIDTPEKNWKISPADLRERGFWDSYRHAYEELLTHTSTEFARLAFAVRGQGDVGSTGVPAGQRPFRFAVADDKQPQHLHIGDRRISRDCVVVQHLYSSATARATPRPFPR